PLSLAAALDSSDLTPTFSSRMSEVTADVLASGQAAILRRLRAAETEMYRRHVLSLVESFEQLGNSLRGVEGRKQVVYFSAGFAPHIMSGNKGQEMKTASEALMAGRIWEVDGVSRYGDSQVRDVLATMTRTLANADCVVHTVDVTGLGIDRSL